MEQSGANLMGNFCSLLSLEPLWPQVWTVAAAANFRQTIALIWYFGRFVVSTGATCSLIGVPLLPDLGQVSPTRRRPTING